MKDMEDNSVDSIVTDPPYGLSFMGKKWDYDVPSVEMWKECLRVLKPGGHLLAFAGTRTQHRMAVNIEDLLEVRLKQEDDFLKVKERTGTITRKTNETQISIDINIDGNGKYKIDTGIGFLDHMLEQLSKHSLMDSMK